MSARRSGQGASGVAVSPAKSGLFASHKDPARCGGVETTVAPKGDCHRSIPRSPARATSGARALLGNGLQLAERGSENECRAADRSMFHSAARRLTAPPLGRSPRLADRSSAGQFLGRPCCCSCDRYLKPAKRRRSHCIEPRAFNAAIMSRTYWIDCALSRLSLASSSAYSKSWRAPHKLARSRRTSHFVFGPALVLQECLCRI